MHKQFQHSLIFHSKGAVSFDCFSKTERPVHNSTTFQSSFLSSIQDHRVLRDAKLINIAVQLPAPTHQLLTHSAYTRLIYFFAKKS